MTPRATIRLQFHKGFTFVDAERLVPYFAMLGISHVYASPITTSRPGSMHGYDVIDPTRVNPELGGEEALRRLVGALRAEGLGLIADIVPNHMAIGVGNRWWYDVLKHGRDSRYAQYFDIDWDAEDPALRGKVLLPFLGKPYGEALAAGEITVSRHPDGGFAAQYFDQSFPIAERDDGEIERLSLSAYDASTEESRHRLEEILGRQNYRLAWWRVAGDEINWRRFFDINELAGLRMENVEAFEAVHALVFRLYAEGLIDGVRVDHVDGLADPASYCRTLRKCLNELTPQRPLPAPQDMPYIVVEKILLRGETLPRSWVCDGTTGYDFMEDVNAVLHDGEADVILARTWASISGRPATFAPEELAARREIIARSFSAQLEACTRAFHRLARQQQPGGDVSCAAIRRTLVELLAHFPIYRTYGTSTERPARDKPFLAAAVAGAKATAFASDHFALDHLHAWLDETVDDQALVPLQDVAVTRFQQLSAPIAAKAVEDTAAYRYGRLLSRNDVGFDLSNLGCRPADFHAAVLHRHAQYPHAMLATATHDHKRGEDVRARLAVLSEVASEWEQTLPLWIERSKSLRKEDATIPGAGDIAMLLQMIIGAWPLDLAVDDDKGRAAFAERLAGWQVKALREAKLATDWTSANEAYESAAREYLISLVVERREPDLLADIVTFSDRMSPAGAVNGLSQALLKLTSPGVPDIYQGTDYWDLSLVDPDNRAPVDFSARFASLQTADIHSLVSHWRSGRIKQAIIARTLALRRSMPRLFAEGTYEPLKVEGKFADHVVAFARRLGGELTVTVVPRLTHGLLGASGGITFAPTVWEDTELIFGPGMQTQFRNIVDENAVVAEAGRLNVGPLLSRTPVALLTSSG
jgi:(1->4)-alpha-D-glucan 1-alpha-D-glucosylmutase